jgi:hypothetical protein
MAVFLSVQQLGYKHDHPAQSCAKIKNVQSFDFTDEALT